MHSSSFEAPTHDAGGTVHHRPALGASMGAWIARHFAWARCALIGVFLAMSMTTAFAQTATPAGTIIQNSASVSFIGADGAPVSITSNAVTATVAPPSSSSAIAILRAASSGASLQSTAGPTQCQSTSGMVTLPPPVLAGGVAIDPLQPVTLASTSSLHGSEAVFVQLTDADQNLDAAAIDTTELRLTSPAADSEILRLSETGPNTGVFVGYIQLRASAVSVGNCMLEVEPNTQISSIYVDPLDANDSSRASALVDPYGVVFDSGTGAPINGARVRLINAATGVLAAVVGDDGVSSYPAEVVTGTPITDAGGTVYTLPAGVFRFPLIAPGSYRVEVDPPAGHAFPSVLDMTELNQTPGAPWRLNAGSFGGTFSVESAIVAIDVPLDPAATQLFMRKSTTTSVAAIGDFVQYTLIVENTSTNAALASVRTVDHLPLGARYREGSTRVAGAVAADPEISADAQTLTFTHGALGAGQHLEIRYVVEITAGARGKQLVNAAQAIGPGGVMSNFAQATIELREELFRNRAIVMGRVVEGDCTTPTTQLEGVTGVRVYLEDGRYSVTDEDGKYHFEDVAPGSHVVQIDPVTIPETHRALSCADRVRHAGRGYSQFIDVRGGALWRSDFVLESKPLPKGAVTLQLETTVAGPAQLQHTTTLNAARLGAESVANYLAERLNIKSSRVSVEGRGVVSRPAFDIESLQPSVGWVTPTLDEIPAIPSIKVAIQHLPSQHVELSMNGAAVSPLNFDGAATNKAKSVGVSRWRGVDLRNGENELVAVVRDASNQEIQRLARKVHYAGGAVRAQIVREASTLVADGRTRPVIALRMVDAYGKSARPGTLGAFRVEAPYRSWWEVESLHDNKLVAAGTREPIFSVDPDGIARLELEPTTQAGTAVLRLRFNERQQQEIRVWLEPQARDWILVGIAEGTAAYNTISDNLQSAAQAGIEEGYADDGRVAFFAKGSIKGEYLLSAAYDSAREHEFEKDRLLGVVEPDRFYTLYGDATEQRFEAATTRKLFIKLERRQFAALFGDFETGLTVTELSRYSRTFTGFKSDYAGERFGYTAFAAESEQGYVQDELQGDGTSGLYRLSQRPLIINSDKIRVEVRDRFRSEVIVETRPLTRYIDYSIDYLNGTLFFKQPMPSRDANFNPVFIIAEYEVLNGGDEQLTAGGRASLNLAADRVQLGASYIQEGAVTGDAHVAGADLRWQIGAATELRAEVARSESDDPTVADAASAYLTELTHVTERVDARAYVREQESGFGVGQQLSTETGTRKIGLDGRYRIAQALALEAETYRQEVLGAGAERELVSVEIRHEADDYTLGAGARHVADAGLANGNGESQHGFVNGSIDLFRDLITLRASQDLELGGKNGSVDFPARSVVGIDYHWRADTTFFAEYEQANGDNLDVDMTRIGVRTTPWERAQLQSSMSQQASEFGPRVFANFGLTQGWQLNERWGFDFGVDQSRTVRGTDLRPFNANSPLASGTLNNDFLATFIGALYRSELWTFTSRLEHRDSDDEERLVASGGFYREPLAGHAFSLATQWFDSTFANGSDATVGDIQLAWAYRPVASEWIVLNRLDLRHESRRDAMGGPGGGQSGLPEFDSARAINNLNSNWQLDNRTQLGLQFGARYVRSTFDDQRYSGFSTLYGVDVRRDLTSRFDIGLHGTMLNSLKSKVSDHSLGFDVGMTVARNVWISIGYNFEGFSDDDFEASRYTAQGPFIRFRMKADQDTFRDLSLDALRAKS